MSRSKPWGLYTEETEVYSLLDACVSHNRSTRGGLAGKKVTYVYCTATSRNNKEHTVAQHLHPASHERELEGMWQIR